MPSQSRFGACIGIHALLSRRRALCQHVSQCGGIISDRVETAFCPRRPSSGRLPRTFAPCDGRNARRQSVFRGISRTFSGKTVAGIRSFGEKARVLRRKTDIPPVSECRQCRSCRSVPAGRWNACKPNSGRRVSRSLVGSEMCIRDSSGTLRRESIRSGA